MESPPRSAERKRSVSPLPFEVHCPISEAHCPFCCPCPCHRVSNVEHHHRYDRSDYGFKCGLIAAVTLVLLWVAVMTLNPRK